MRENALRETSGTPPRYVLANNLPGKATKGTFGTAVNNIMNCQNCRLPLKLNNSLQNLNPAAYDLLVGP